MAETHRHMALWGADHVQLGAIAALSLGDDCAIALSRGRHPKGYEHLDPNEDAVGAVFDGEVWLLAVVDGHWGFDAARAALDTVLGQRGAVSEPERRVRNLFSSARDAVAQALARVESSRRDSRTTLTVALVRSGSVTTATLGDSSALLVTGDGAKRLGKTSAFLGPDTNLTGLEVESATVSPGDVLVLCTDGLSQFLGRGWTERIGRLVRENEEPETVLRLAVEEAFRGGAGDNIAIASLRL